VTKITWFLEYAIWLRIKTHKSVAKALGRKQPYSPCTCESVATRCAWYSAVSIGDGCRGSAGATGLLGIGASTAASAQSKQAAPASPAVTLCPSTST